MSFEREVWETLSKIDVNQHTEKKGKFTYLSWSWAWAELMSHYPESTYKLLKDRVFPDGSMEVRVSLTVKDGEQSVERTMWLPVMNHQNKAIQNPDAMDINKTRMRALVKAIAMAGLGAYIFAGEDLPSPPEPELDAEIKARLDMYVTNEDALRFFLLNNSLSEEVQTMYFNSAEQGQKGKLKDAVRKLVADGRIEAENIIDTVKEKLAASDPDWKMDMEGLEPDEKKVLAGMFDKDTLEKMKAFK